MAEKKDSPCSVSRGGGVAETRKDPERTQKQGAEKKEARAAGIELF